MDWILFVFKSTNNVKYLVAAESEEDAWSKLRSRQSMRMEAYPSIKKAIGIED